MVVTAPTPSVTLERMQTQAIILAAGQGTRMNHPELPKVLIEAGGRPILRHVLDRLAEIGIADPVIVIGFRAEKVRQALGPRRYVLQETQNGTGSAVKLAKSELGEFDGGVYLVYGDHPCISTETYGALADMMDADPKVAVIVTTGKVKSIDERYGRILRQPDGTVDRIVEFKDGTQQERAVTEYNAAPYLVRSPWLWSALGRITPSPVTGEYYLTDIVQLANQDGMTVLAYPLQDQGEAQGVNTKEDLAAAEAILNERYQ